MNKLIAACVEYLDIRRPYRVSLQNRIKNPDWFAYCTATIDNKGNVLRHNIVVTMQDMLKYDLNTIIAHEFVHAWQFENHIKGRNHGKKFQNKAMKLAEYLNLCGFNIGEIYRPDIDKP